MWFAGFARKGFLSLRGIMLGLAALFALSVLPAAAQDKIVVGALRFVSNGALFVAIEKGYLKAEGLDVDLKFFEAAQPVAVAVVSGDIDIGMTGFTGGMFNLAGKGGIKVIAAQAREKKGYEGNAVLVSNAAWEKGFRKLEDFPGKTLGITQVGSSFHYQVGQIARVKGFDIRSVEMKPLQALPAMAAALKTSQVDSIIIAPHLAKGLVAAGDGKLLAWYSDLDEYQFGATFTSPKAISGKRAVLEKFIRAYQKGATDFAENLLKLDANGKRVFDDKSHAIAAMIAKHVYPSLEPAKAIELVEASTFYVDPLGRLDVGDIHGQVAWFKGQGLVDAAVDPKAFIDLTFVQGHTNVPK